LPDTANREDHPIAPFTSAISTLTTGLRRNGFTQTNPVYGAIPFASASLTPPLPTVATGFDWHINTTPYLLQYNVNIQHEILSGTVLNVGYVGFHGVHLLTQHDQNPPAATIDANGIYHFATVNREQRIQALIHDRRAGPHKRGK
jgi:hypothetical protein